MKSIIPGFSAVLFAITLSQNATTDINRGAYTFNAATFEYNRVLLHQYKSVSV